MIQPDTWKRIHDDAVSAWSILGPLVGVLLGAWLATRNQRRHWLLDNKRAEYRKLLTTLSECASKCVIAYGRSTAEGRDLRVAHEAMRVSTTVIYSRLFIAKRVQELELRKRWTEAISLLSKTRDPGKFGQETDKIMDDIRRAAVEDLS